MGAGAWLQLLNDVRLPFDFVEQLCAFDQREAVWGLDEVDGDGAALAPQLPLDAHFIINACIYIAHLTPSHIFADITTRMSPQV